MHDMHDRSKCWLVCRDSGGGSVYTERETQCKERIMFRKATGSKAQYHYLTLHVAADFDEWRIFLEGPGVIIHGGRQFTEAKAKEAAIQMADNYIRDEKKEALPNLPEIDWTELQPGEWLNWRP